MADNNWDKIKDTLTTGVNALTDKWDDIEDKLDGLKEMIGKDDQQENFKKGCEALKGTVPSNEKWDCMWHGTRLFPGMFNQANQESGDHNEEDPESGSMAIHVRVIPMA